MNRPTADDRDDSELAGWLAMAGDPGVDPRPEHVDRVRTLMMERLSAPAARPARRWVVAARILIASAGLLLLGLGLAMLTLLQPANAWARITRAIQEKPWIHLVGQAPRGGSVETWMSPRLGILAVKYDHGPEMRGAEYHDLKAGIKTQYVAAEDTIYRLPEADDLRGLNSYSVEVLRQLLVSSAFTAPPFPGTEIVEQTTRTIAENGRTWKQVDATFRVKEGRQALIRMVLRVDPATGLPATWDVHYPDGVVRQVLDYPEVGPADILALGVPATARRVDRVPGDDLHRLLEGMKLGRNRFDDYCGYVWYDGQKPSNVNRVWRKGHRWRVESVQRRLPTKEYFRKMDEPPFGVPPGVDLAWWRRHEPEMIFEPTAICDGRTIWYYRYDAQVIRPDQPYVSKGRLHMTQTLTGSADDPMMPWPHLLPEQQSHPAVYVPTQDREFIVDAGPTDGPPGTVRLRIRDTRIAAPDRPDLYRLWIDPMKNHLAIRAESSVFEPNDPARKTLAYLETQTITEMDRSPSGFWYPTRVVRKTSEYPTEQVYRFLLDFRAGIPDDLFRPLD